jgi:intracellular septation protein A
VAPPPEDLRDRTRQQILDSLGGWSGTVVAAVPLVAFVIVNAVAGLRTAVIAAVASAVLVAGYRMARRQPVQQALTGLVSVAIAAAIAARTGQARGFFVLGIVSAFGYAALFALSLLVRRPLVGVLWEYLDPSPLPPGQRWHKLRELRRAYDVATVAVLAMFLARAVVQLSLFKDNRTGLLAVAKLVMGLPLYLAVVAVVFWVVRRARHRLGLRTAVLPTAVLPTDGPAAPEPLPPDPEPAAGLYGADGAAGLRADSAPDGGLSLRKGDE